MVRTYTLKRSESLMCNLRRRMTGQSLMADSFFSHAEGSHLELPLGKSKRHNLACPAHSSFFFLRVSCPFSELAVLVLQPEIIHEIRPILGSRHLALYVLLLCYIFLVSLSVIKEMGCFT